MDFQYREMGLRIKIRRKELKIKQAEMAEALAISNNLCHLLKTDDKSRVWIFLLGFVNTLMSPLTIFYLELCMLIIFPRIF